MNDSYDSQRHDSCANSSDLYDSQRQSSYASFNDSYDSQRHGSYASLNDSYGSIRNINNIVNTNEIDKKFLNFNLNNIQQYQPQQFIQTSLNMSSEIDPPNSSQQQQQHQHFLSNKTRDSYPCFNHKRSNTIFKSVPSKPKATLANSINIKSSNNVMNSLSRINDVILNSDKSPFRRYESNKLNQIKDDTKLSKIFQQIDQYKEKILKTSFILETPPTANKQQDPSLRPNNEPKDVNETKKINQEILKDIKINQEILREIKINQDILKEEIKINHGILRNVIIQQDSADFKLKQLSIENECANRNIDGHLKQIHEILKEFSIDLKRIDQKGDVSSEIINSNQKNIELGLQHIIQQFESTSLGGSKTANESIIVESKSGKNGVEENMKDIASSPSIIRKVNKMEIEEDVSINNDADEDDDSTDEDGYTSDDYRILDRF